MNAYLRAAGLLATLAIAGASLIFGQQSSNTQTKFADTADTATTITVTDHDHRPVTGLGAENFTLYVDGQRQAITSVTSGDIPACIGILVDKSGSMRHQLPAIASAIGAFVAASNPGTKTFLVAFNDAPVLEQDFTSDGTLIEKALTQLDARGGTAFYDSLIATADHLAEAGGCSKRVLLAVSDGEDNESRKSLEYTLTALQHDWNPLVYAIGLPSNKPGSRSHRTLEALTSDSGGLAIFVNDFGDVRKAALKIADILKNQYLITYSPAQSVAGGDRAMKAELRTSGHKDLTVRLNVATKVDRPAETTAAVRGDGCISGSVLDENKKPVGGMNVEAYPVFAGNTYPKDSYPQVTTDEKGKFRFAELQMGPYQLYTKNESAGYPPTRNGFYRTANYGAQATGKCANVVITLGPKAVRLKVSAIDEVTHEPITRFGFSLRRNDDFLSFRWASPGQEVLVPPNTELAISGWSPPRYLRTEPVTFVTTGSDSSQEITVELSPRASASTGVDK